MAFRDGVLVYRQPGALPAAALEDLITRVKALDMAEVRAKIARRKEPGRKVTEAADHEEKQCATPRSAPAAERPAGPAAVSTSTTSCARCPGPTMHLRLDIRYLHGYLKRSAANSGEYQARNVPTVAEH